jgi:hypothetical protein
VRLRLAEISIAMLVDRIDEQHKRSDLDAAITCG